jgi:hypothetical protein
MAERQKNSYNLALVRMFACLTCTSLGDSTALLEHASELDQLGDVNPAFASIAELYKGLALEMQGKRTEGIEHARRAIGRQEAIGLRIHRADALQAQATAHANEGQLTEAFSLLSDGRQEADEVLLYKSSMLRLKADLLVQRGDAESEVESAYRQSVEFARQHDAKFEQLRTTIHFARWLNSQKRAAEACAMLTEIYNWFTEGFDTVALKDAKALLDELNSCS